MARTRRLRRALAILPVLACIAGCSANGAAPAVRSVSPGLLAQIRPDAQHYGNDWMYSTSPGDDDATVYHQNGNQLTYDETLPVSLGISSPKGTVATRSGWWYVTNAGDSNVLVFRSSLKGPKGPLGTPLDDRGQMPVNVAVTPNRNLVAVSNASSLSSGTGSVSVYVKRATEPARTLTYGSDLVAGEGISIDRHGNCYWSFNDLSSPSGLGSIVEFAHCNGGGSPVISNIPAAAGLAFDNRGNLYYIDESSGVYKCRGLRECKIFATGFGLPVSLNFDSGDRHLWVADATGFLDAVDPQSGLIESQTVSINGDPYGIAPSPGE